MSTTHSAGDSENHEDLDRDTEFVYAVADGGELPADEAFTEEDVLAPGEGYGASDFDEDDFDEADFGEVYYASGYGTEDLEDLEVEGPVDENDPRFGPDGPRTEEEWAELEAALGITSPEIVEEQLCTVAIVGRPNVGKSTLTNRFLGRRAAVVEDFPGVTRDRVSYLAEWNGRRYWVQDTGGWDPDAKGMHAAIARQAENAMAEADIILFVVDTTVGITDADAVMARKLHRADVPVLVVANKFESDGQYAEMAEFYALGLGDPYPVSALHGRGGADVLDEVVRLFPDTPKAASITSGPRRVALVGKPNVGKSSLLNKLTGEDRAVVDNVAGTTVDPVDSLVQLDNQLWKFVDTAGLRKKVKHARGHEFYASLRTKNAIDSAEVCVLLVDSSQPITEQDQRVLGMVIESGKALVIAYNKWDLMDEDQRDLLERDIEEKLAHVPWARRVNISAKTGRALQKIEPMLIEALESWDTRISTGKLNNWVRETIAQNPPPMKAGRLPRVLFATQASTRPPVIVLFTTGFLDAGYRRYLERKFRESFGFEGSPVRIAVRVREKRKR
ncbi:MULTISPECIES: ribosome biogenesis GTPase Der [unclassified Corynebacterium]|uniref:ribosome biogenesis GTPase Der n=1 Tax=unclassified Corynebacterium TaxID=2624378 RepID=UPI001C43D826|nr:MULTISPECIES: ribosome biogenesis GTPase Der [unclassified Corynebacterium]MBV7280815.1 ribosome biogenesis GTPase Der [Corynebacterium sp. TAE3-ERU30]MBV7302541.1 ribosome biogenesis GTPase Der [Corynebacterium sp. TAE3-ERU2]